jgi:hypothetical protein
VGLLPQRLQQHIRRGRQQHAELVRPEARATRPIQCQSVMQFLEPILHIATLTIDGIDGGGRLAEIRHHEARIAVGIPPREPYHLGFDDDASTMRPALGRIEGLPIDVLRAAAVFRQAVGLAQQAPGAPLQPRVAREPHDILDPLRFQEVQSVVPGKAPIHTHPQWGTGKGPPQLTEQGPQQPERAVLGRTVPRSQDDRDQILVRFVIER